MHCRPVLAVGETRPASLLCSWCSCWTPLPPWPGTSRRCVLSSWTWWGSSSSPVGGGGWVGTPHTQMNSGDASREGSPRWVR